VEVHRSTNDPPDPFLCCLSCPPFVVDACPAQVQNTNTARSTAILAPPLIAH